MEELSSIGYLLSTVMPDAFGAFGPTWWRGQPEEKAGKKCKLLPRAYRPDITRRMEWRLTTQFMQRARTRQHPVPDQDHRASWLFLMQHHGLPTRLLDWTESPLIAIFFAVHEDSSTDSRLWALSPDYLNVQSKLGDPDLVDPDSIKPYFDAPFLREDPPDLPPQGVVATLTTEIHFRMLQQQSVFTIHATGRTPIEELPDNAYFLKSYRIPFAAKEGLRKELFNLGIREANLYPDLEHLAADLRTTTPRNF